MSEREMIKLVNGELETMWTVSECKMGKKINVDWVWWKAINKIVPKYRERGWEVTKHVTTDGFSRHLFLTFKNPELS